MMESSYTDRGVYTKAIHTLGTKATHTKGLRLHRLIYLAANSKGVFLFSEYVGPLLIQHLVLPLDGF